jgi:acetolactate synthase-1/2/3 large subunit
MISGSKIIYESLVKHNVKQIFGYSGGAILGVLNEFYGQNKINFTMSRTELGAGFMAEGYAKSTKTPGVVMTTSGPGALNTITSMQNALSDGTPILVLSGQVATNVLGTQAFQESDVINISKPCTKWNNQVNDIFMVNKLVEIAFHKMLDKRHGPVLLDLPKDIMSKKIQKTWLTDDFLNSIYYPYTKNNNLIYNNSEKKYNICPYNIHSIISISKKPVILAGQGVFQSNSVHYLRKFAKSYNIPVTTTLLGLGIFDENEPLSLKMLGMHGSYYANKAIQNSDLLINFGSRFDDRITGNVNNFAKDATIIHVDIAKENIGKTIKSHYMINDSCDKVLESILKYNYHIHLTNSNRFQEWHSQIREWKKIDFSYPNNKNVLQGRHVISVLNYLIQKDTRNYFTIVADVGAHQMWAAQFIDYNYPKVKFITSGGLGSMGFALPASIGVKFGKPEDKVIAIVGDGGFTMTMTEILTAIDNNVNIKVLIINNSRQVMVSNWQKLFYDGRLIATDMKNPPFEKVCESFGCKGVRIDINDDIEKKLQEVLNYENGPIVANIITDPDEMVLPMVKPGNALDDMLLDEDFDEQMEGEAPC